MHNVAHTSFFGHQRVVDMGAIGMHCVPVFRKKTSLNHVLRAGLMISMHYGVLNFRGPGAAIFFQ